MYGKDYIRYSDLKEEKKVLETRLNIGDPVNSPSHYKAGGIEAIEAIEAALSLEGYRGYLKASVMKYMWRYEKKEKPLEDLKKARWFLNRLIEEIEGKGA